MQSTAALRSSALTLLAVTLLVSACDRPKDFFSADCQLRNECPACPEGSTTKIYAVKIDPEMALQFNGKKVGAACTVVSDRYLCAADDPFIPAKPDSPNILDTMATEGRRIRMEIHPRSGLVQGTVERLAGPSHSWRLESKLMGSCRIRG